MRCQNTMPKVNSRGANGQKNRKLAPGNPILAATRNSSQHAIAPNANSIGRIHLRIPDCMKANNPITSMTKASRYQWLL